MKAIGFKNFRRFENLEPLQLGGVNFFVGGNNSGKSTVVKAIMLLLDNLYSMRPRQNSLLFETVPSFRFDANHIHDVHVGTFARALRKPYPEVKEMCFEAEFWGYKFILTVTGNIDSTSADADVTIIEIVNLFNDVHYIFDFDANSFVAKFSTDVLNAYPMAKEPNFWQNIRFGGAINMRTDFSERRVQMLEEKIAQLKLELETQKNPVEIARINNSIKLQTRKLKNLKDIEKPLIAIVENKEYKSTLMMDYGIRSSNFIMNLLESQWMHYMDAKEGKKQEQSNDSGDQQEFRDSVARQIEVEEFYNGLDIEEKAMLCMFANDARQIRNSLYRHKV